MHYNNNSVSLLLKSFNISLPGNTSSSPQSYYHSEATELTVNGNYSIKLSFSNTTIANQSIDIDSVVLMWDYSTSKFYQSANETMKNTTRSCWTDKQRITNHIQDSQLCKKIAFSVNTQLFNGSVGKTFDSSWGSWIFSLQTLPSLSRFF